MGFRTRIIDLGGHDNGERFYVRPGVNEILIKINYLLVNPPVGVFVDRYIWGIVIYSTRVLTYRSEIVFSL